MNEKNNRSLQYRNSKNSLESSMKSVRRLMVLTSAVILGSVAVGCTHDPEVFNPKSFQKSARARASENVTPDMRPMPTAFDSPYLKASTQPTSRPSFSAAKQPSLQDRPTRRMSLKDIVKRVVTNNAESRVASYQAAMDQARVIESEAAYDLKYFMSFNFNKQNDLFPTASNPSLSPTKSTTVTLDDMQTQFGFKQDTATGAKLEAVIQTDQFFRSGPGARNIRPNPFWTTEAKLQVSQPLLQNFGGEANAARIAVARNTEKVSLLEFRVALEKTLFETEQTYWQLVQAEQDVKIREQLLGRTIETTDLIKKRTGTAGTTNTELAQANAAIETRRLDLVRARSQVTDLSDTLKNKMNDPELPVSSPDLILATDVPTDMAIRFDRADQIQTALTYRAEIAEQQIKIDSTEITIKAAKNNELPKLDLVGSIGVLGVGININRTLKDQARFDYVDYAIGFQFEFPIGNREARAIRVRTELQRLQAIQQYRQLVDQVTFDVLKAEREVITSWEEMAAARTARLAAIEELTRLESDQAIREGTMNPGFINAKLDAQQKLSDLERREMTAIVSYNIGIVALEKAKGTILRYDNVVLEEEVKANYVPKAMK